MAVVSMNQRSRRARWSSWKNRDGCRFPRVCVSIYTLASRASDLSVAVFEGNRLLFFTLVPRKREKRESSRRRILHSVQQPCY